MNIPILTVRIHHEYDVVAARQRARHLAQLTGLDTHDQARFATAVSEIARNAFIYAGKGNVEFSIEGSTPPQVLAAYITDSGPGIEPLEQILAGQYKSTSGLGLGIIGARRLVDRFQIDSAPNGGTRVCLRKILPAWTPLITPDGAAKFVDAIVQLPSANPLDEIQAQNRELAESLNELQKRQDELVRLNQELEDTNRGVIALYAELDEKADHLRRADELKSRFLSNMSHEFRTPLNSMIALSRLLLNRTDGDLSPEQDKQVNFIYRAAEDLSELVNDLLDLAKVEAGKIVIRPAPFQIGNLFGALRGMLRPLLVNDAVNLMVEDPNDISEVYSDEAKVSQILRNLLSNALKFTEHGEVRLSAQSIDGQTVTFSVSDTGIGIAAEDQVLIFQEFSQLENPIQKRVRGTGLGLPLSKRLAELLGGAIQVTSEVGVGTTFSLTIPLVYTESKRILQGAKEQKELDVLRIPVLVVEDTESDMLLYERFLSNSEYQVIGATTLQEAHTVLQQLQPAVIILDVNLRAGNAWSFLARLKSNPTTQDIPVLVISDVDDRHKGFGLGAAVYAVKPIERTRLLELLQELTLKGEKETILLIEDEEAYRYVLRRYLSGVPGRIAEAATGTQGLLLARALQPRFIVLDLGLPDQSGYEVLQALKKDPLTDSIPVVVVTGQVLSPRETELLSLLSTAILSKSNLEPQQLVESITQVQVATPTSAVRSEL